MTKMIDLLEYLRKYIVFDTLTLENEINKTRNYSNLVLYRLEKTGRIHKIEKNKYTLYKDPFLLASRIIWPSYISGWAAFKYYNLTEQIPHDISVITTRSKRNLRFNNIKIVFKKIKGKNFFGYEKIKYNNFEIFIANPEKAIIDSALLKMSSFSEIIEIFFNNKLKIVKLLKYLKKTKNKSLIKRFGYLLELKGKDHYQELKKFVDTTYVPLDYSKKKTGKRNEKWRLIINA